MCSQRKHSSLSTSVGIICVTCYGKPTEKELIVFKRMLREVYLLQKLYLLFIVNLVRIFEFLEGSLGLLMVGSYGNGKWCLVFLRNGV